MKTLRDLRKAFTGRIWYMHEPAMHEMFAGALAIGADALASFRAHQELLAARPLSMGGNSGTVAVIPIHGMITHRGSIFSFFMGGTSTEGLTQQVREAANDPNVSAIVLDIDSPGGDVDGVDELAAEIYAARKMKPITAVANCLCASAAYYLASQASEVYASPSSLTGSVGVYTVHEDDSEMLDQVGIKLTVIKFGENKAEGNPYEPLSASARAHLQEMIDAAGEQFEKAVARGRGLKQEEVHKKFGQGRVFGADKAVRLGMADKVGTLDDALAKHGARRVTKARERVASVEFPLAAEKKTKRVAGEDLEKSAFAYHASDKLEDWKLPIEFSTTEKTETHIRNAIAQWSKTDMPDVAEKDKARGRIRAAAKEHDIEVSDSDLAAMDELEVFRAALEMAGA